MLSRKEIRADGLDPSIPLHRADSVLELTSIAKTEDHYFFVTLF
jgi:hypothetical protein